MNDKQVSAAVPKPRRWRKILAGSVCVLALLLVVGFFVGTSAGFLKSLILPRVSQAANATISVEDASISPFSHVVLKNLKVQTTAGEPLVTAAEVRLRYHLMDILGGNLNVDEVAVVSPTVNLVRNADGSSNLDPLLKVTPTKQPAPPAATSASPLKINLKKLALINATVRQSTLHKDGTKDVIELSNVNFALENVGNAASGKFSLGADVKVDEHPPQLEDAGTLQAKIGGDFTFALAADLKPLSVQGNLHTEVRQATGALSDLATLATDLECDITPAEIKQIALRFQKSGASMGALRVSGPFTLEKSEGKLTVELLGLDRQLLNLAGARAGLDLGGTTINSTNQIELSKSGAAITANGQLVVANFQATRAGQATPVLDLRADYSVAVDRPAQTARLSVLNLNATQNQNPLLHAELSSPMNINWGAASGAGDSSLNVEVTKLNLADWRAFAASLAPSGLVNTKIKLVSQAGGKQLGFDLDYQVADLSLTTGSNSVSHADVHVQSQGSIADFQQFKLDTYRLELAQHGDVALTMTGVGTFNNLTQDFDFQLAVQAALVKVLAIFPQPGAKLAGGALDFKGHVTGKNQSQSVNGELTLTDLAASATPDQTIAAKLKLDASVGNSIADLRQCQLTLTPTARAKNELTVTGKVDFSKADAVTGGVKLAADALDLTGYYNLLTGQTAPTPKAQPAPVAPPRQQEPAAVKLPFHNFTVEAAIGRLYLREVDIANFQTTVKLDGGEVLLNPFQLVLNGAPVKASATVNLGVPGFNYDVSFSANRVPVGPLVDTFSPDYQGKANGVLIAGGQVKGAGITGAGLQKNLAGEVSVVLTNADIKLVGPKAKALITPIALVLGLGELTSSPLTGLNTQLKMGGGKINLMRCDVLGEAFRAQVTGEIPIATVLNDSPINDWPVNFSLSRSLAGKAHLLPANVPASTGFVQLPTFVKLGGTVGNPAVKTDKLVISGLVAKSAIGLANSVGVSVGGDTTKIIQGVGNLLSGQKSSDNSTGTNTAPAHLLDLFKKKK